MIVRPISSSHICLRCQLRLARNHVARRPLAAFLSTTTSRRADDANGTDPSRIDATQEGEQTSGDRFRIWYPGAIASRVSAPPGQRKLSEFPLGRLYGFQGRKVRERKELLDAVNLGKPSEVLILNDVGVQFKPRPQLEPLEAEPLESVDILARLAEERGLVGHQEVMDNIDEIRPKTEGKTPQTWKDVNELVDILSNGFTVTQLATYIDQHGVERIDETTDVERPTTINGQDVTLRVSPWLPGVSESIDHFDRSLNRGYNTPKQIPPKKRLAFLLIRDCWAVKIPEVENGFGEVEIYMAGEDLEWLLKGAKSPLSRISRNLLKRGEKIEASRSRKVVRITAPQQRAELLIPEIENVVKNIRHDSIGLKGLLSSSTSPELQDSLLDPTMHMQLGKLSEAEITAPSGTELDVSYIHDSDAGPSSPSDVARRLLLSLISDSEQSGGRLGCLVVDGLREGAFVHFEQTAGLNWHEKFQNWTRWTVAATKDAKHDDEGDASILVLGDHGRENEDISSPKKVPSTKPAATLLEPMLKSDAQKDLHEKSEAIWLSESAFWVRSKFTASYAMPGAVLHRGSELPYFQLESLENVQDSLLKDNTFLPTIPNLSRVLRRSARAGSNRIQTIIMHLKPSPWSLGPDGEPIGIDALRVFPPIELRFSVQPKTRAMELKDALARVSLDTSDLLLPHQQCDLRFQQQTTCRMGNPQRLPAIKEFIESSTVQNGVPKTPASLVLPIPSHLCGLKEHKLVNKNGPVTNVEYMFVSHEMRETIPLDFQGWALLYTSVQASDTGDRRSEVRLRARRSPMWDPPAGYLATQENEDAAYTQACLDMANEFGTGAAPQARRIATDVPVRFIHGDYETEPKGFKYFTNHIVFADQDGKDQNENVVGDSTLTGNEDEDEGGLEHVDEEKIITTQKASEIGTTLSSSLEEDIVEDKDVSTAADTEKNSNLFQILSKAEALDAETREKSENDSDSSTSKRE
ncbi:hypothetical protein BP6252_04868 [Coleophoma cylindrospora]|uniref:Uncharacterized protein n=1 Tax=Coleophoma cylindrospora TaxID=1849047 RepID=A0A3D8S249_9HELO|nr:hypothetical protein BP6252_04868 [Coleophoma cylindrospora]